MALNLPHVTAYQDRHNFPEVVVSDTR
jgi:hypothetical protein